MRTTKKYIKEELELYESVGRACECSDMDIINIYIDIDNGENRIIPKSEMVDMIYDRINN